MALDYRACAQGIYTCAGGAENILQATHCATRLRLELIDSAKADLQQLQTVEGVQGVYAIAGQLQVVLGTGTVNKVYEQLVKLPGMDAEGKAADSGAAARMPLPLRMLKSVGDTFVPLLPALAAAGLMSGLLQAFGQLVPTFAGSDWYSFLSLVAGTAFDFLPVLVAASAARAFGGNIYLGGLIGLCMIHPGLISAWNAGASPGLMPSWQLLWFEVPKVGYQGHVIPLMITVWVLCKLERWLHRRVPEMLDLYLTPMLSLVISAFLAFTVIGPVFAAAERQMVYLVQLLLTSAYGLGSMLLGGIYSATVVCGLHHIYDVMEAGMVARTGMNILMPVASAANVAQCGACLAVALKTQDRKQRAVAVPAALSALLGITEPAIFGINLRHFTPFLCAAAGGALGGLLATLLGLSATSYGVSTLLGMFLIQPAFMLQYLLVLVVACGTAFVLTLLLWKNDEKTKKEARPGEALPQNMVLRCSLGEVAQPVPGVVIPIRQVSDPVFSQGLLGVGVAIRPSAGVVFAPIDGQVVSFAPTGHAIGLRGDNGIELLIHIGIDTVKMGGKGFTPMVTQDTHVKAGQQLMLFSPQAIREAGFDDTVMVAMVNSRNYPEAEAIVDITD